MKLTLDQAQSLMDSLHEDWGLDAFGTKLSRHFAFKGYAKAVYLTNLCVWLADKEGHHPDLAMGWGYVDVHLTTHDAGGLSQGDFSWAAKLDALLA